MLKKFAWVLALALLSAPQAGRAGITVGDGEPREPLTPEIAQDAATAVIETLADADSVKIDYQDDVVLRNFGELGDKLPATAGAWPDPFELFYDGLGDAYRSKLKLGERAKFDVQKFKTLPLGDRLSILKDANDFARHNAAINLETNVYMSKDGGITYGWLSAPVDEKLQHQYAVIDSKAAKMASSFNLCHLYMTKQEIAEFGEKFRKVLKIQEQKRELVGKHQMELAGKIASGYFNETNTFMKDADGLWADHEVAPYGQYPNLAHAFKARLKRIEAAPDGRWADDSLAIMLKTLEGHDAREAAAKEGWSAEELKAEIASAKIFRGEGDGVPGFDIPKSGKTISQPPTLRELIEVGEYYENVAKQAWGERFDPALRWRIAKAFLDGVKKTEMNGWDGIQEMNRDMLAKLKKWQAFSAGFLVASMAGLLEIFLTSAAAGFAAPLGSGLVVFAVAMSAAALLGGIAMLNWFMSQEAKMIRSAPVSSAKLISRYRAFLKRS